jgi:hypothetical protein
MVSQVQKEHDKAMAERKPQVYPEMYRVKAEVAGLGEVCEWCGRRCEECSCHVVKACDPAEFCKMISKVKINKIQYNTI